jgi:branched-chain amino acid transport system permease protein
LSSKLHSANHSPTGDPERLQTTVVIAFVALALVCVVALPFVAPSRFWITLATEIMILAVWALSLNLLAGYTGLVSFGHAAYFGLGAYGAALAMIHVAPNVFVGLLAGTLLAGIAALLVGYMSVRLPGIAFSMLTLAFAQAFFTVAFKWRGLTGGDDGLRGMPRPTVDLGIFTWDAADRTHLYWLAALTLAFALILMQRIVRSPFGAVLLAIRENEERARFIGYNTRLYKFGAFVIAGLMAGFAGTLFVLLKGFVSPGVMHWSESGRVLMMAILGGTGTLFGPVAGALVYMAAQEVISGYTQHWMLYLGGLFVLLVLFAPGGLASLIGRTGRGRLW